MKQYIKNNEIKTRQHIVIVKDGMRAINPTEEMILEDGWVEYVAPEPTDEERFTNAKRDKVMEIELYDSSHSVNEFYVQGNPIWLDKATRAGLLLRFQAEKAQGLVSTVLWYNGQQFPLSVDNAIAMLYAIELYASACYDNTQRHYAAVNALTTVEELDAYDYKAGYPEKLRF